YPESQSKFFTTVVAAQVSFVTDAHGRASGLVLHQKGRELPATRIDDSQAKKIEADLDRRIKTKTPSPGTEAALRKAIIAMEKGQRDYSQLTPELAAAARAQWPKMQADVKTWGPLQSINLSRVSPEGIDIYAV